MTALAHGARRLALVAGVVVVLGVARATFAQSVGDTSAASQTVALSATGEQTYREICQACHMANAEGGRGAGVVPALAANPHLADKAFVLGRVVRGKGGMPAFAGMLTPEQIAGVVGYVRTHFGNTYPDPVTPAEAKALTGETGAD